MPHCDTSLSKHYNKLVPHRANFGECDALARAAISTVRRDGLFVDPVERADAGMEYSSLGNAPTKTKYLDVCHRHVKRLLN